MMENRKRDLPRGLAAGSETGNKSGCLSGFMKRFRLAGLVIGIPTDSRERNFHRAASWVRGKRRMM